jgi:ATP/maltotriose-dependent transcriptional regulator MalT
MDNRRAEGIVLGNLGQLFLVTGEFERAREYLAQAEHRLRTEEYPIEVGKVLCTRAELERRMGDARAGATLDEVARIAVEVGARPDSELCRRLASARQALAGATGADEP